MWQNQEATDKNLEALQHNFHIENIRGYTKLYTSAPNVNDMKEGEIRWVKLASVYYLYSKLEGVLKRVSFT